jgi:hypothetical protein
MISFESRKQLLALIAVAALGLPAASFAHGSMKPQHGGIVQMTGETLVELVPGPAGVALYVKEDDEEVESSGVTVKLTVTTAAGAKSDVQMTPAGGNRFEAKGVKVPAGSKVGVMVVNKATQARSSVTFAIK